MLSFSAVGCGSSEPSHQRVTATVLSTPEPTSEAPPPPDRKRHVRITAPRDGAVYDGKRIGHGQRRALVRLRGTGEPDEAVFVAGNGDGTSSSHDDATVTVSSRGRWHAAVNAYGCGPEDENYVEMTAGYDEAYADEDTIEVEIRCDSATAPSEPEPTPTPAPPSGPCSAIPARNFPVPPRDPRDSDGDGIACET
jgi:hypothetical protein